MAERFKAPVLKTGVRLTRTVGSNPTPSEDLKGPRPGGGLSCKSQGEKEASRLACRRYRTPSADIRRPAKAGFCYNHYVKDCAAAAKLLLKSWMNLLFHFLIVFPPSGGFGFPQGWAFFSLLLASSAAHCLILARNPSLTLERREPGGKAVFWDRILAPAAQWSVYAAILVSALERGYLGDAGDFRTAAAVPGLLLYGAGGALFLYAMASNAFFSSVSRTQQDRGQSPQTGGPYRWIRHPGYAGACLQLAAIPATLGSAAGAAPALAGILLFVIRTRLEDGMLARELPGYADYALKVRSRLVPGFW